jgi:hypothetical protein
MPSVSCTKYPLAEPRVPVGKNILTVEVFDTAVEQVVLTCASLEQALALIVRDQISADQLDSVNLTVIEVSYFRERARKLSAIERLNGSVK